MSESARSILQVWWQAPGLSEQVELQEDAGRFHDQHERRGVPQVVRQTRHCQGLPHQLSTVSGKIWAERHGRGTQVAQLRSQVNLTLRKIAIWMSKNCQTLENFFCQKFSFFQKMNIFGNFFFKFQVFGNFFDIQLAIFRRVRGEHRLSSEINF